MFYRAINKYGKDSFDFNVIERDIPIDIIHEREKFWIKEFLSKAPTGYNLTDGGEGTFGYRHSDESKLKMSIAKKGKPITVPRSEEYKQMISRRQLGRCLSEETKKKISEANKGKTITLEHRELLSKSLKGRIFTETHIENMKKSAINRNPEQYIKGAATRKANGVDFAKHFKEMNELEKNDMYNKISMNNKRSIPIRCLDLDGNIIKEFNSFGSAGKWISEIQNVSKNAKRNIMSSFKRNGTAYGYKWEYIESQTTISL